MHIYILGVSVIEARHTNRHNSGLLRVWWVSNGGRGICVVILGTTFSYLHKDSLYDQLYTEIPAKLMLIIEGEG